MIKNMKVITQVQTSKKTNSKIGTFWLLGNSITNLLNSPNTISSNLNKFKRKRHIRFFRWIGHLWIWEQLEKVHFCQGYKHLWKYRNVAKTTTDKNKTPKNILRQDMAKMSIFQITKTGMIWIIICIHTKAFNKNNKNNTHLLTKTYQNTAICSNFMTNTIRTPLMLSSNNCAMK